MTENRSSEAATAVVIDSDPPRQHHIVEALQRESIEVVGLSPVMERAAELVDSHLCDLLVLTLDEDISPGAAFRVLRKAHRHQPNLVSMALVNSDNAAIVEAALAAGVFAAVARTTSLEEVARLAGQALAERRNAEGPSDTRRFGGTRLTCREVEILRLAAGGRSNNEVANLLWITSQTVKFHLANTYRKLGVRNRFEASQWAAKHGLIRPDDEQPEGDAGAGVREPRRPIRPSSGTAAVVEPPESGDQFDDIQSGEEEAAA